MPELEDSASRLTAPVIPYRGSVDGRPIERALNSLKKLDQMNSGKRKEQRASKRFPYNSNPVIIFPEVSDPSNDYPPVQLACAAWTRNLSNSGTGIVVSSSLTPIAGIDDTVSCIDLTNVLLEGSCALVGLFNSRSNVKWIESQIAWARSLSGLGLCALDLGLRFEDQHSREWPDANRLEELAFELHRSLDR